MIMLWKAFKKVSMGSNDSGRISSTLLSLQLQLGTLLEEAGGEAALTLLDTLAGFNKSEQRLILNAFSTALQKLQQGEHRLFTREDAARKSFEDGLYQDIVQALTRESQRCVRKKLHAVEGGVAETKTEATGAEPIDLAREREARKNARGKSLLN